MATIGSALTPASYNYSYLNSVDINDDGNIIATWEDTEIRTIVVIQVLFGSIGGTTVQTLLVVTELLGSRFDGPNSSDQLGNMVSLNGFGNRVAFFF